MKIEKIALREISMHLKQPFESSFGVTQNRRILLIELHADGIPGWGEVTQRAKTYYRREPR
jgi:O-succinylbenzoate synthase